ncbi:MAG: alpha/beta fold hydrolase [Pseudomonadota bacterium]
MTAVLGMSGFQAHADEEFDPTGYWTGAIIKNDSVLPVELQISFSEDGLRSKTTFPDWLFYRPYGFENVRVTSTGLIIEDLLSGDAVLELEPRFEQLIGTVGDDGRRLHLKRAPAPPRPLITSEETSFTSADGTRISATLTLPEFGDNLAGMVMVRGRGCASRLNGRARFFAKYGLAVLTYDKRGAGKSEGDCETFTLEELTDDAIAAFEFLASQPDVDGQKVGFFGESAGAWTIQAGAERMRDENMLFQPAFLITWIGPSTSIIQQQISSAETYGESVGLSKERQELLANVSRIIVDSSLSDDEAYDRLAEIRRKAEVEGWLEQGFGGDDIPSAREDMPKLWLRRFSYDPANFLQSMKDIPYLAVFGAKDPIVPVAENVQALKNTGSDVEIVVLKESGHGYDFSDQSVNLPSGGDFWLYEGPDTGFTVETLEFLRRHGFLLR